MIIIIVLFFMINMINMINMMVTRQQTEEDTSVAEEEGRNISLRCRVSGSSSSSP